MEVYFNDRIKKYKERLQFRKSCNKCTENVNLRIEDGEYVAVMGASGSGKSTLLNILGGLDKISQGTYFYNDINVGAMNNKELNRFRKEHISFIFQNYALMNFYTVYENTEVPLIARGIRKKNVKAWWRKPLRMWELSIWRRKLRQKSQAVKNKDVP